MKHGGVFDSSESGRVSFGQKINDLEAQTIEPGFWNDSAAAEKIFATLKSLKNRYEPWKELRIEIDDLETLHELASDARDERESAGIQTCFGDSIYTMPVSISFYRHTYMALPNSGFYGVKIM